MYKIIGGDGNEYGPVDANQIRQWIRDGRAGAESQVQPEGSSAWLMVSQVPELAVLLHTMPPASIPSPGSTSYSGARRTNPMALTGMIMGIASLVLVCCCYGLPFNILGIVFSLVGLSQIKANAETQAGKEMALAGLICSIASAVLGVCFLVVGFAMNFGDIMKEINKL